MQNAFGTEAIDTTYVWVSAEKQKGLCKFLKGKHKNLNVISVLFIRRFSVQFILHTWRIPTSFFNCASCLVGKRCLSITLIATSRPLSRWTPAKFEKSFQYAAFAFCPQRARVGFVFSRPTSPSNQSELRCLSLNQLGTKQNEPRLSLRDFSRA